MFCVDPIEEVRGNQRPVFKARRLRVRSSILVSHQNKLEYFYTFFRLFFIFVCMIFFSDST